MRSQTGRPSASEWRAGVIAGTIAGVVMSLAMMVYTLLTQGSVWINPNLIAVMWLGPEVAGGEFTSATMVGFATHMATSAAMGLVSVPFIYRLPRWRTFLAALAYTLASYPFVFALFLSWWNPLMVERTQIVPMTASHAVFGVVLGAVYLRLAPETVR